MPASRPCRVTISRVGGAAPARWSLSMPAKLPSRVRVAIGFTSRGAKGKAIGECWDNRRSGGGHFEIFIRPDLAHASDAMPAQIAAILAHELVHAAVGIAAGYTVRTARKWLETAGAPLCPVEGHGPMRHDPVGDGTEDEPD